jgi:uncharacterized OsmC-like protein
MSIVDHSKLRDNYLGVVRRLEEDSGAGLMSPYVSAELIEDVSVKAVFEQYDTEYIFYGDEAANRGGHERGPSPMRYFLSGIAFCMLGWYAKGSAFAGCEVDSLTMDVRTFLDMRGEHGFEDRPVHPQRLVFAIDVTSPSASGKVLDMIDWGDARCPLGVLVRRAVPVYESVTHNGTVIRNEVPAELA